MSRTIAIDFGTTNSSMATFNDNKFLVIPNSEGELFTPSVVAFTKDGKLLVGQTAKSQAINNLERTIFSVKRKIGTNHIYSIGIEKYTPTDIVAMLLKKLKKDAESYLGESIKKAVITVPSYFSNAQRQALFEAGKMIELEVLRLISTPSAIGLDYILREKEEKKKIVLVFDFGGGSLSISVLEIGYGVVEVKATIARTMLGGMDYDIKVFNHISDRFIKESTFDIRNDPIACQRLLETAESAKIELSAVNSTDIYIPYICNIQGEMKNLQTALDRATFDGLTEDLTEKAVKLIHHVLYGRYETFMPEDIDLVLLAGGSTRLFSFKTAINKIFGGNAKVMISSSEAIMRGASYYTAVLAGDKDEPILLEVYPFSVGIETNDGNYIKIIHRNDIIPTEGRHIITTANDNQSDLELHVLQGEHPKATNNISLGRYVFEGIPPAPRGLPKIEVCITIYANYLIMLSIKDLGTSKEKIYRINSLCKNDEDYLDLMDLESINNNYNDKADNN